MRDRPRLAALLTLPLDQVFDCLAAEVEDSLEIAPDDHGVGSFAERAESNAVAHPVAREGSAFDRFEGVRVMPQCERALQGEVTKR